MKKLLGIISLFILIPALVFAIANIQQAHATQFHTKWSNWVVSKWGECIATAECGTSEGIRHRTRTRHCLIVSGNGVNECNPTDVQIQTVFDGSTGECEVETPECPTPTVSPTPTPTPTATPSAGCTGECGHPTDVTFVTQGGPGTCGVIIGEGIPANFHVYRKGGEVIAKWVPDVSQGSQVVIWYGHNGKGIEYSTVLPNSGYEIINVYDSGDYTFWISYKNGCFIGDKTQAPVVDGATTGWTLFTQTP